VFEVLNVSEERSHEDEERPGAPVPERVLWHRDVTLYFDADVHAVRDRLHQTGWLFTTTKGLHPTPA